MSLIRSLIALFLFLWSMPLTASEPGFLTVWALTPFDGRILPYRVIISRVGTSESTINPVADVPPPAIRLQPGAYSVAIDVGLGAESISGEIIVGSGERIKMTARPLLGASHSPRPHLQFAKVRLLGSKYLVRIRYELRSETSESTTYSGPNLEVAIGRVFLRAKSVECTRAGDRCLLKGPVKTDLDGPEIVTRTATISSDGGITLERPDWPEELHWTAGDLAIARGK